MVGVYIAKYLSIDIVEKKVSIVYDVVRFWKSIH